VADFPIRLVFGDELEYLRRESIRFDSLAWSPTKHNIAFTRRCNSGSNARTVRLFLDEKYP